MAKFFDKIEGAGGAGLPGLFVRLLDIDTNAVVPIYADASDTPIVAVSGLANAAKTDERGNVRFHAPDGTYDLEVLAADGVTRIDFIADVSIGGDAASFAAAAQLAAEQAETAAATLTVAAAGKTWYVSPTVTGTSGAGTEASPWSFEHAVSGAAGAILPGDTVLLRGQKPGGPTVADYKPYTTAGQARSTGFNITVSGTATKPVTFKNYPGETVTFSDPLAITGGWTKVTTKEGGAAIDASCNVYETVNSVAAGTTNTIVGYYQQNGDWHVLATLRGPTGSGPYTTNTEVEALYATSSRFKQTKIYHSGPTMCRLGNGKIRIRLDPCYTEAHETGTSNPFFGETTQVYPASTNPASVDLRIYLENDVGITLNGNFVVIDGGSRESQGIVFHGFMTAGLRDQGNNNTIKGCRFYAPYVGLLVGAVSATSAGTYRDNYIDGMLDYYKSPFSRGDVKNADDARLYNRGQGFKVGSIASNGRFYRNTVRRTFDGVVFSSAGWEIGYTPDLALPLTEKGREALMWDYGNIWEQIWDDGMQVYASAQGTNIHHNKFLGAGISRDGANSAIARGSNKVKVHHNIFDGYNYKVIWDRAGRTWTNLADIAVAKSTVNGSFSATATTVTVASGAAFGALTLPASVTICKASAPWSLEQVQITAIAGNDLTLVRSHTPIGASTPDAGIALSTGDIISNIVRDTRQNEEGRTSANVLPTHGVPSGTAYRFPWDFYHNTIMTDRSQQGKPNLYLPVMMFGTEASNVENGAPKNQVFNNLFLLGGVVAANNAAQNPAIAWLGVSRIYTGRGEDIIDGNIYAGIDGEPMILLQLLQDSASVNYNNSITTIAGLRATTLLSDVQTFAGYAPGWESTGLAYTSTMPAQIDANYRPLDSRALSGAIELTRFSLPGMEYYQAWRGAVGPL